MSTHDERVRRLAVRPRLGDGRLLLPLRGRRARRERRLCFPARRARVVPVFLLDAYPDPVLPADKQFRVFGLVQQLFDGRPRFVGPFGREPEVGTAVVIAAGRERERERESQIPARQAIQSFPSAQKNAHSQSRVVGQEIGRDEDVVEKADRDWRDSRRSVSRSQLPILLLGAHVEWTY